MKASTVFLAACAAVVNASPSRTAPKAATCTPKAGGSSTVDDTPAIQSAIADCPSGTIVIPASTTYHVNSALSFDGCSGCTLEVEGTLLASDDTKYWNNKRAIFLASKITGLTVVSKTGKGIFDGNGQASWDRFATDKTYRRPTLFYITGSTNVHITDLRFKNPPNVFHSAASGSSHITYTNITLDAVSTSKNPAHNTDGWDIGGSEYVTINGASVLNDDDCVAFKPGANFVEVYDISCNGSHGISVGSLGKTNTDTVTNVLVRGAHIINSAKAAGIKFYPGGASHGTEVVKNVTLENFVVDNTDYAFQVQTCYGADASYCKDSPSTGTISGLVLKGFSGTTSKKYSPVVSNFDCSTKGTCDITVSGWTVKSPSGTAKNLCANTPSKLGITCSAGASG